jgi:hypothetical protein
MSVIVLILSGIKSCFMNKALLGALCFYAKHFSKEWSHTYSFNKPFKPIIIYSFLLNKLLKSYSNMLLGLTKKEFTVLLLFIILRILFDIYPATILDAVHYLLSTLMYSFDFSVISCDAPRA